jgi:hypothetical protein
MREEAMDIKRARFAYETHGDMYGMSQPHVETNDLLIFTAWKPMAFVDYLVAMIVLATVAIYAASMCCFYTKKATNMNQLYRQIPTK